MSLEQLTKLTPGTSRLDFGGGGGGKPEISWEDVAAALADESLRSGHASPATASEYAWCFILKHDRLKEFKRKMFIDLGRYWVERKLDHPGHRYLLSMIDVACMDANAGSGKKPRPSDYVRAFGCDNQSQWYKKHRPIYLQHVYHFIQDYEGILRRAMAKMNYDDPIDR